MQHKTYLAIRIALFALILSLGSLAAMLAGETQGLALADLSDASVQVLTSARPAGRDAAEGDTLYAALAGGAQPDGIYRSQDGGATWQRIGAGPGGVITALAVHPEDTALLYAGAAATTSVLWGSRDGGQSWQPAPLGLPVSHEGWTPTITALALDARRPGVLYVGTDGQGVYQFDTDPMRYGFELLGGLETYRAHVKSLVVGPNSRVYAITNEGLFIYAPNPFPPMGGGADSLPLSEGGARGWGLPELPASLAVAPGDGQTLYAGGVSSGAYRSQDGGQTWERIDAGLEAPAGVALRVSALAVAGDDARHVAAATAYGLGKQLAPGGVYESRDGGAHWTRLGDAAGLVTQLSFNRGAIYAASPAGLARYEEAGASPLGTVLTRGQAPLWGGRAVGSPLERLAQPNPLQALILLLTLALAGLALAGRAEWVLKRR